MKKEGIILAVFLTIVSIGSVSAYNVLDELRATLGPETVSTMLLFLIFFALIKFPLEKVLKNKGASTAISFGLSLGIVYFLDVRNISIEYFLRTLFSGARLPSEIISPILIIAFIGFIAIGLKKKWFKSGGLMLWAGLFLIIISLIDNWFHKDLAIFLGIILIAIGLARMKKKEKDEIILMRR